RLALRPAAVGVAAPGDIGGGEVGPPAPAALVDEGLQAGAVGARLGAEDAEAGLPQRRRRRQPLALEARGVAALSMRSICAGKASRKKPETRTVTSTRGRSSTPAGRISKPLTRPPPSSQV